MAPIAKTNPGRFFEDYKLGDVIHHAVPRTVAEGERALYHALYPARHALYSSDEFAGNSGLEGSPIDDLDCLSRGVWQNRTRYFAERRGQPWLRRGALVETRLSRRYAALCV